MSQTKLSMSQSILLEEYNIVSSLAALPPAREGPKTLHTDNKVARWTPRQWVLQPRYRFGGRLQHAIAVVHAEHAAATRCGIRWHRRDGGNDEKGAVATPRNASEDIVVR
jgi:hypothetical protein